MRRMPLRDCPAEGVRNSASVDLTDAALSCSCDYNCPPPHDHPARRCESHVAGI
ncbi:hypothetical protein C8Q78DRAFT_1027792 [Trametes maxima]|nr:hypothetical protein C8Q78DRAFT_1027792 [Trametes maxima]